MQKEIIHKVIVLLGTLTIFGSLVCFLDIYLDKQIDAMYSKTIEHTYGNKNEYVLKESAKEENIVLLGSSELSSPVKQNPIYIFPNSDCKADITIDGRAYVQSLLQAMNVTSLDSEGSEHVNLAVVVSLQWFQGEDIDKDGFAGNFSQLQFMNVLFSDEIKEENKKYICERTNELLDGIKGYEDIEILASLKQSDNKIIECIDVILSPYYKLKYHVLKMKDKLNTYKTLKNMNLHKEESNNINIDWEMATQEAENEGRQMCTNNTFFVENEYYDTYLRDVIGELKNKGENEKLESKEREDFQCFLSICQDLDIRPYVIMMNTNGKYYDYLGIDAEKRNELYQWVKDQTENSGYECLVMPEKEYEPYFMRDVMHLGWKGWIYVDQKISEYFSKG